MANYRIVCTDQTDCSQGGHIIGVGTGEQPSKADQKWSVSDVYRAIVLGHGFYTHGGGSSAWVRKHNCACGRGSLRSTADATVDNNLDNLRLCNWKK